MTISSMGARPNSRRWLVAASVSLGVFASALDSTVNVALPTIADAFETDITSLQWVIIAFVTTSTALGVSMGSAGDRFGLPRFFRAGLVLYALAMLLIGLAPSLPTLVAFRVIQGIASAAVLSVGPALIGLTFDAGQRGRALGVLGSMQAVGGVAAGFGGGLLVDALGWPWIFLGRIPFLLLAFVLTGIVLRGEYQRPRAVGAEPRRFDIAGAATLAVAVGSLLVGLNLLRSIGATAPATWLLLGFAVLAAVIFPAVERRAPWPVLDLALFRRRAFSATFAALLLNSLGIFTIWFVFPFFVSDVLGWGATRLGVLLGTLGLAAALSAPVGGRLADRVPPRHVVTAAGVIVVLGLLITSSLGPGDSLAVVALPLALAGLGQGALRAAARALVFNTVPEARFGTASGALNLGGSMGIVVSVAVFTAVFDLRFEAHQADALAAGASDSAGELAAHISAFRETFRLSALVALCGVGASLLARE